MVNMVRLFDAIYEEKINLYSFDVFDTTLTRLVLSPEHIYTVMEEKIRNIPEYPSYLRCNFLFLRRDAEKVAYRLSKDREEITLDDIYCYLREEHNLSERQKDQLVELEIETERKLSYGIEETIAAISELKKRGKKVVLISNTVHAGSTLQKLLRNVSTDLSDIPVYASSDYGVTKNTGKLFEVVRERERVDYSRWKHIGDSMNADVIVPKRLGMKSYHYVPVKETKFDKFLNKYFQDFGYGSFCAACGKILRQNDKSLYDVGVGYGGIFAVLYAEYLIEQCIYRGIKKLYFVSRDGFIVKKCFDILVKKRGLNIESSYLYGSRKAWNPQKDNDKQLLIKYLEQEFNKSDNFALVDCFGTGSSYSNAISMLVRSKKEKYFCFYRDKKEFKNLDVYGFVKDIDVWDNIERFFSASEGSCIKYDVDGSNLVYPIVDEIESKQIKKFGYDDYIRGVEDYVRIYSERVGINKFEDMRAINILKIYFAKVNEFPDDALLHFLVDMPSRSAKGLRRTIIWRLERKMELKIKKIKYLISMLEKSRDFNLLLG